MAHEDEACPRVNARAEGEKILRRELLIGAAVNGDARVGIHIVAIAGEVLEDRADGPQLTAHAALVHLCDGGFDVSGGGLGAFAEGAGIDKVRAVLRHIRHGGEVDVHAVGEESGVEGAGLLGDGGKAAGAVDALGGFALFTEEIGVAARAGHGAALFVGADEEGDGGILRRSVLERTEFRAEGFFREEVPRRVLIIGGEEQHAAEMIVRDALFHLRRFAADEEELAHLFFKAHGRDAFTKKARFAFGFALRRGLRLEGFRRGSGRLRCGLFGFAAGTKQQRCEQQRKDAQFHTLLL